LLERGRIAFLDLTTLGLSFVGFLGMIAVALQLKSGVIGVPRLLFLTFLALSCAPFLSAFWRIPKPPYLIAPTVALFLLYPITAPHGIIYGRDPIYNFAFTNQVATTGFWQPGSIGGLADTYSLYPLGNVFQAYLIRTAGLDGEVAFLWLEPMIRMLAVPATVYAIGQRLFGRRIAPLGLFVYMGTASILFNTIVQQGMGIIFVSLAFLALLLLAHSPPGAARFRTEILFALLALGVVMTHHLSSYIFAAWLLGLAAMVGVRRSWRSSFPPRFGVLAAYFLGVLGLYIVTVSYRVFIVHEQSLQLILDRLIAPESLPTSTTPRLGRTFSTLEIAWLGGSVLALPALGWFSVRSYRHVPRFSFVVANGWIAALLAIGTLPLLATGFDFVPLRVGEYTNLFLGPLAAATFLRWSRGDAGPLSRFALSRIEPMVDRVSRKAPAVVVVLAVAIFIGGNLAPAGMRMYFDGKSQWNTDTPLLFGADDIRLSAWSRVAYGSALIWGDHLSTDIFTGLGYMHVVFGNSVIFAGPTINWSTLCPGDYVAVSTLMTTYPSQWFLEPEPAVRAPLTHAQVDKFGNDPNFSLVFQDGRFSVYRLMSIPPPLKGRC